MRFRLLAAVPYRVDFDCEVVIEAHEYVNHLRLRACHAQTGRRNPVRKLPVGHAPISRFSIRVSLRFWAARSASAPHAASHAAYHAAHALAHAATAAYLAA